LIPPTEALRERLEFRRDFFFAFLEGPVALDLRRADPDLLLVLAILIFGFEPINF